MAELRKNRAKHKLEKGETVIAVSCSDTDTIDILGSTGVVDLIWIEMEHGSVTWSVLSDISRVCDLWSMTSLVRGNNNDPWLVGRALDRGVQAVVVPHVNNKTEAERLVIGGKFTPEGMRGMGGSRQGLGVADYTRKANDEIMLVALIEDVVGLLLQYGRICASESCLNGAVSPKNFDMTGSSLSEAGPKEDNMNEQMKEIVDTINPTNASLAFQIQVTFTSILENSLLEKRLF